MRASTLATFEEVYTEPEISSPDRATSLSITTERIRGGAAGAANTVVTFGTGSGGTGDAVCAADGRGVGAFLAGGETATVRVADGGTWIGREADLPPHAAQDSAKDKKRVLRMSGLIALSMQRTDEERPVLSIVVPLYNEEGNVSELVSRVSVIVDSLNGVPSYEIILVNDGSRDATAELIRTEMRARPHIVLVNLSRNFGHQLAATAGLDIARGDAVVLMDGDLQDPPELIAQFVEKWRQGYDVVYAVRRSRKGESRFKVLTASLFYRVTKRLTKVSIPVDTGDFRLMSRRVTDALGRTRERNRFLRGLVSWVGFNQTGIAYDRDPRLSGKTKYPVSKMLAFAIDGITSFSEVPLRFASYFGICVSMFAFLYAIIVLLLKFEHRNFPGYTSTIVAILFLGGVQLLGIGILGEYLGRVYDEVKGRPLYLIAGIERSPMD